jgi:hypothetical protein
LPVITHSSPVAVRSLNPNFDLIEAVADAGNGVVDLWEASPVRLDSNIPKTDAIIDILFPGNPLLCCGWSRHYFGTRPRRHWHKLHELQFIVPNPMTKKYGLTKSGKLSAHSLENTGERRFLAVEFDFDPGRSPAEAALFRSLGRRRHDVRDLCAALLLHLAGTAPLALAVYSGGKSLHGWFHCAGEDEGWLRKFMDRAALLGADNATWGPSQFVRMPDGKRDNGRRQTLFYFNPSVIK